MSLRETIEYGTVTKAELIREITNNLRDADAEDFAKDVSRFLNTRIETTDDPEVFEYWQPAIDLPNLFWKEVNDDVFVVRYKHIESINRKLRVYERSVTIDLATFDKETIEKCLNRRGYTLEEYDNDYQNIHDEYDEDAEGMMAVFLSGKDDPSGAYTNTKPVKE